MPQKIVFLEDRAVDQGKSKMTIVDGRGFDEIVRDTTNYLTTVIKRYDLSQKMSTRLVHDAWAQVEQERAFRGDPETYVREHLDEQINAYRQFGLHASTGCTAEEFKAALEPLVQKTMNFFTPPAGHPILDGEFTCFLVLPPEWGISLRSLLGRLRSADPLRQVLERITEGGEVARGGGVKPKAPYVLVGVKGGRALKDHSVVSADKVCEKFGYTYLSAYQFALLLLLRPKFLLPGESAILLGEKFSTEHFLQLSSHETGVSAVFVTDARNRSLENVGKPYYTRLITM